MKVAHDDYKGRAIRRGPYSLETLVSHKFTWQSVDSRDIESTNQSSQRVAPLEHMVHPEGHVAWMMMMRQPR